MSPTKPLASPARIAVIPGDGIGVEVTAEAVKVLRAAAAACGGEIKFQEFDWGANRFLRDGVTLPDGAVEMLRRAFDAILFGALGDPRVPFPNYAPAILLGLRFKLDLYANVRPVALLDRRLTPLRDREEKDVNFTVIRENTEGLYVAVGGQFKRGTPDEVAVQEDVNTRKGVERILRYAFDYAARLVPTRRDRAPRLCMSDKSNVLTFGHELWQRVFAEVKKDYPGIEARHLLVDTLAMEMVRDPSQFDVIVTCNMFGDILSDLAAQLAGGLGLAPSGNINPESVSLFEPVHGSAPNIAGTNTANPAGAVLSAAMMLDHLASPVGAGLPRQPFSRAAALINAAVRAAIQQGKTTRDLGGSLGTREMGDFLADFVTLQAGARP